MYIIIAKIITDSVVIFILFVNNKGCIGLKKNAFFTSHYLDFGAGTLNGIIQEGMPRRSSLSIECIRNIIDDFVAGTTTQNCAQLCYISRTAATHWYHQLRIIIFDYTTQHGVQVSGEVEIDERYLGEGTNHA